MARRPRYHVLSFLFAATLFLSAILLFLVQPMIAKMLLPFLGGAPAVWTTCMVFFQAMLLAGYAYSHCLTTLLPPRRQAVLHLGLLLLAALVLPIGIPDAALGTLPRESNPVFWLLGCLLTTAGLPFFVVSTSAPLLQKWFSKTGHPSAHDPYFLYAASNLGSLVALLGYPLLVEPSLRLREQSGSWAAGYAVFAMLIAGCLLARWRAQRRTPVPSVPVQADESSRPPGDLVEAVSDPLSATRFLEAKATELSDSKRAFENTIKSGGAGFGVPPSGGLGARPSEGGTPSPSFQTGSTPQSDGPRHRQTFLWVVLAFVPSSLMLGVTTYLTTDIASIPLLWVLPLALYLLTFVLVFANRKLIPQAWANRALPVGAVSLTYLLLSEATQPSWLLILLHLFFFFVAAMVCHGRLAQERPSADRLTEFYLWISVGGVLGGLCNALLAPAIFTYIVEYPIGIVLACLLSQGNQVNEALSMKRTPSSHPSPPVGEKVPEGRLRGISLGSWQRFVSRLWRLIPSMNRDRDGSSLEHLALLWRRAVSTPLASMFPIRGPNEARLLKNDWFLPLGIGIITVGLSVAAYAFQIGPEALRPALAFGLPLVLSYALAARPFRFSLALGGVLVISSFFSGMHGRTLRAERNFFGVLRVTIDPGGGFRRLVHGNTIHGRQFIDPARQSEPLSYYHRTGPLGQIFNAFNARSDSTNVAVVGLGAGSMACYATPAQTWTYYEINPAVIRFAENTNYFTFLRHCAAAKVQMAVGDARLRLREAPDHSYNLIILDAFSSDSIPTHLITREALELYLAKLAEAGMLAFHISNRCLDLEPVLGGLARNAGLTCVSNDENEPSSEESADGKDQSHWVVMTRRRTDLGRLIKDSRWPAVSAPANSRIWTDDYSNILGVFKWE